MSGLHNRSDGPATRGLRRCALPNLGMIRVGGEERVAFLQGQLTQDVRTVGAGRSALYGWTSAQGRLLLTGQLFEWRDALWLTAPAAGIEGLVRRLRMFVLRAKVTVETGTVALTGLYGAGAGESLSLGGLTLPAEPLAGVGGGEWYALRVGGDPARVLVAAASDALPKLDGVRLADVPDTGSSAEWQLADIRAGLAHIVPETVDALIPQMVNLDLLGGVSFRKGCYVGQEIVTRAQHLGRIKRRTLRFRCSADATVSVGAPIYGIERDASPVGEHTEGQTVGQNVGQSVGQSVGKSVGKIVATALAPDGAREVLAVTLLEAAQDPVFADAERRVQLERLALPYSLPEANSEGMSASIAETIAKPDPDQP